MNQIFNCKKNCLNCFRVNHKQTCATKKPKIPQHTMRPMLLHYIPHRYS